MHEKENDCNFIEKVKVILVKLKYLKWELKKEILFFVSTITYTHLFVASEKQEINTCKSHSPALKSETTKI